MSRFAVAATLLVVAAATVGATGAGSPAARAAPGDRAAVVEVRVGEHPDKTRFVLEVTAAPDFDLMLRDDPRRVVIDFPNVDWHASDGAGPGLGLIAAHRHGLFEGDVMRVVLDLARPAAVRDVFWLPATADMPFRFVLDLEATDAATYAGLAARSAARAGAPASRPAERDGDSRDLTAGGLAEAIAPQSGARALPAAMAAPVIPRRPPDRRVVVLDPGHGGIDPGATGVNGVQEKAITLDMARRVARLLEERGGYRVVLTRERDAFLRLRERVRLARRAGGDLFVSLHADSNPVPGVRGASVYTLSDTASDREAALLAAQENRADALAGVELDPEDDVMASILIDLAQRQTKNDSTRLARLMVDSLGERTRLVNNTHRHAGFAVLKAPDVPSVLVELGYLSNDQDARELVREEHLDELARAIAQAIERYFHQQAELSG